MASAAMLSLVITQVYQKTFKGERYSQSFVHTIIIMSVVVSVVMNVVSNNAGVAFGLFAIFSLIRFRSAVTDGKDIAYIFFGLCVGMTCGLYQIGMAVVLTFFACAVLYLLYKYDYGRGNDTQILKVTVPENLNYEDLFEDILTRYTDSHVLRQVETTNLGTMILYTFAIRSKNSTKDEVLINRIRERNANLKVSLSYL
ncbi:cell division protein FtsZ [Bacillus sp. FJAT-18017]|nr:cell division protein FtsZ [Bacillus sp. FJAT-18017]